MTPEEHVEAAKALFEADENRKQIGLLSLKYPKINMADSYAIQSLLIKNKVLAGRSVIGWKIGLTSKS